MKTRLGKIVIGTVIGAGALGAGFGASMAVASAATTHAATTTTTQSTSSSSGAATKAVNAATPSPARSGTPSAKHNCPNMGGTRRARPGASGSASSGS